MRKGAQQERETESVEHTEVERVNAIFSRSGLGPYILQNINIGNYILVALRPARPLGVVDVRSGAMSCVVVSSRVYRVGALR